MDQVGEVREKTDIVSLINEYVPLKKTGSNFKALCPFHNEKSPSFVVSPERQIWHCFGCSLGGDCFTFLMQYEHMEFPEALRMLAKRTGVELTQYKFESGIVSKKEHIYKLNALAAEFYHFLLTKHAVGKKALQYLLEERKIKQPTINTYMLGFSPHENALSTYLLQKKQYKKEDLLEAGLATSQYNRLADFFRGRLMFPLYDHRGNTIGFSGRVLENAIQPKYINTPETLVYHKGSVFFGLNSAKDAIKKENRVIIMEGEFDVIASFQEGITNAVAVKGTALTEDQARLISRFAQKVTLCFDGDRAGREAIKRSLPILEKKGLITTVVIIPAGKDADEAIKHDPIAFKQAVKHDKEIYDYLFEQAVATYDPKTAEGKKHIGDDLLPTFSHIENEIVKEHYLKKLSDELHISQESLTAEMEKLEKKEIIQKDISVPKTQKTREEILEEYLLALIVQSQNPYMFLDEIVQLIREYTFHTPAYQKLLSHLQKFQKLHKVFHAKTFLQTLPKELIDTFDICFLFPLAKFSSDEAYLLEVKKTAKELYILSLHKKIKDIGEQIRQKDGQEEELLQLQAELSRLVSLLPKA